MVKKEEGVLFNNNHNNNKMTILSWLLLVLVSIQFSCTAAFAPSLTKRGGGVSTTTPTTTSTSRSNYCNIWNQNKAPFVSVSSLAAGKGFGQKPEPKAPKKKKGSGGDASLSSAGGSGAGGGLESIQGGSAEIPTMAEKEGSSISASEQQQQQQLDLDPNLSVEERNQQILRQKYGLVPFEERMEDAKQAEKMKANQKRMAELKQMADAEQLDIFALLPPPVTKGIDFFLKAGLAITTTIFVAAGIGITAEAWSVASGTPLPENIDTFIVNTVEPNFTTGLLVLLGFSISLGIFATAQLGSSASSYSEDP